MLIPTPLELVKENPAPATYIIYHNKMGSPVRCKRVFHKTDLMLDFVRNLEKDKEMYELYKEVKK